MFELSKKVFNFKKLTALIFSIILLFVNSGGADLFNDSISLVSSTGVKNHLFSVYSHCFYDSTVKLSSLAPIGKTASHKMYMAKNESEFCQIAVRSNKARGKSFVKISDFTDKNGNVIPTELFFEYEVAISDPDDFQFMPDPLIPLDHECKYFSQKETNYVFAIVAKTDKNAVPGDYSATVEYGNQKADGNKYELSKASVTLHVWDFELPTTPALTTAVGNWANWDALFEADGAEKQRLNEEFYELLLSHRLSPYSIPVSLNSEKGREYLNDERMTSFCIGEGNYEYVQTNPEWAKKAYFYPIDEPRNQELIDKYIEITDHYKENCPGYNMVTPFFTDSLHLDAINPLTGEKASNIDIQDGRSNIICANTPLLVNEPGALEKILARQAKGDKFWMYVCVGPDVDENMCNVFIQQQGLNHRILFWQHYDIGAEGFLYWCASYWGGINEHTLIPEVWEKGCQWAAGGRAYGDGYLVYPVTKGFDYWKYKYVERTFDENTIIPSLRLECIMDGVEDYDYFKLAEGLIGKDKTDKILHKVTTSLTEFTYSDSVFKNARIELGSAIEKASK